MHSTVLQVHTGDREVVRDLTAECADFVSGQGDGLLHVFVPHATAGIAILETGAGSDDDLTVTGVDLKLVRPHPPQSRSRLRRTYCMIPPLR